MAINVTFEGYVNEVKQFGWGDVARVSHAQRGKNEQTGEWETIGTDYFDVTLPAGTLVSEKSVVKVTGILKVGTYPKKDGTQGIALKVRATEVEPVERRGGSSNAQDNLKSFGATEAVW